MQFDRVVQWSRECFFASRRECQEVLAPMVGIVPGVALIAQCLSIIPVTSAPTMIGYGAGGFATRDMMRRCLPLAAIMYGLMLLFMFCYWPLVGLWK